MKSHQEKLYGEIKGITILTSYSAKDVEWCNQIQDIGVIDEVITWRWEESVKIDDNDIRAKCSDIHIMDNV